MSIKISYKNNQSKTSSNLVLFVDEKFSVLNLKKHISGQEYSFIIDLIKTKDKKKNIIIFDVSSKRKIILVSSKKIPQDQQLKIWVQNFMIFLRIVN